MAAEVQLWKPDKAGQVISVPSSHCHILTPPTLPLFLGQGRGCITGVLDAGSCAFEASTLPLEPRLLSPLSHFYNPSHITTDSQTFSSLLIGGFFGVGAV
jgi:hypothetical protein